MNIGLSSSQYAKPFAETRNQALDQRQSQLSLKNSSRYETMRKANQFSRLRARPPKPEVDQASTRAAGVTPELTRQRFEQLVRGELTGLEREKALKGIILGAKQLASCASNAVPGIYVGIPLVQMAAVFTGLHYGKQVMDGRDIALQVLLGYFTYGVDRLLDAMESESQGDLENLSERKQKLYKQILENKPQVIATLAASFAFIVNDLAQQPETMPFIPLLLSTLAYKDLKESAGTLKPFYISFMWTACSVILPCVSHDKGYEVLASPQDYLPMALLMFGATNILDAADIDEDIQNGIKTLPVQLGKWPSYGLAGASIAASIALIGSKFT